MPTPHHTPKRRALIAISLGFALLSACDGGLQSNYGATPQDPRPSTNNPSSSPVTPEAPATIKPAITIERQSVRLLPFKVRLNKLSQVIELPQEDPVFDSIKASRYELGDFNHAQGIRPDLTWGASKMGLWVKSIKPICAHPNMRQRFPTLPEHLNELILSAYGREADEQDLIAVEDIVQDASLDEATRYQTLCLATLSSMEFIAQ